MKTTFKIVIVKKFHCTVSLINTNIEFDIYLHVLYFLTCFNHDPSLRYAINKITDRREVFRKLNLQKSTFSNKIIVVARHGARSPQLPDS